MFLPKIPAIIYVFEPYKRYIVGYIITLLNIHHM